MKNDGGASFSLQPRLQPAANFGVFFNGAVLLRKEYAASYMALFTQY